MALDSSSVRFDRTVLDDPTPAGAPPTGRIRHRRIRRRTNGPGRPFGRGELAALLSLLAATALAYTWDLSASGFGNSFYAAAVQAATKSWKAFFFGSLDSSNFITVDKPPASLWVMDLSARLFGFSSWSILVPEAIEGVAAVALVYLTVRRWFGARPAFAAGLVMATTPVAALMFRFDNPDALLVLLMAAGAYCVTRAVESGRTGWLLGAGTAVGFAFLAKMGEALLVVPAFGLTYLVAGRPALAKRFLQLGAAAIAVVVSAGWWVLIVTLWPASSRPMIDGSPTNSIWNLIVEYNGLGRVVSSGSGPGGGFSGSTGALRLFNSLMGGQASWLLPAAAAAVVAGLIWRGRAGRTDRVRAAVILWGGWLLVTGAVFSYGQGIIHTYYTVALAPPIAALVGIAAGALWDHRHRPVARWVAAALVTLNAAWAIELLRRTPSWYPGLRWAIAAVAAVTVAVILAGPYARWAGRSARRIAASAVVAGVAVVSLGGPAAYTLETVGTPHTGSVPSAGPAVTTGFGGGGGGGGGGGFGGGGFDGARGLRRGAEGGAFEGGAGGFRPSGAPPSGSFAGGGPTGSGTRGGAAGGFGGAGGGPGGTTVSSALITALKANAGHYRWVAATNGSQSAASIELASGGLPVMAIGGFSGEGGNISLATFEAYVKAGNIHYYLASGGGAGGFGQGSSSSITAWVEAHYKAVTIGGQTVYDLTQPTSSSAAT